MIEKKLTEDEVKTLISLEDKYKILQHEIGKIEIEILNLERLKDELYYQVTKGLEEESSQIAKQLQEKYGEGQIDLEKGIIQILEKN